MKTPRRNFITLAASATFVWPLVARAQQPAKPIIGFLNSRSPGDSTHLIAAFHRGLAENGKVDGQNVTVEFRWAFGNYERLPQLAAELVRLPVNVIAATGGEPSALAAKAATSSIPIVFAVGSDPIKMRLVTSYNRRLQPLRHLHDCSGCFQLERLPGGTCTHWKAPPSHGAHP